MALLSLLLLALAPGLILIFYFSRKDPGEKEPTSLIIWTFILGAAAVIPIGLLELPLLALTGTENIEVLSYPMILLSNILFVGLVEEAGKYVVVRLSAYKSKAFNEVSDGITYTIAASLGFATLENIFYVMDSGVGVGILRAVLTVPNHALQSGIMGYFIGLAKIEPEGKTGNIIKGILIAGTLHGITNSFAFSGNGYMILIGLPSFLIGQIFLLRYLYKKSSVNEVNIRQSADPI